MSQFEEFLTQEDYYKVNDNLYKLVVNYKEQFNYEHFISRYNNILDKYDFIVGDISYEQLRLKGFYYNDCKHVPRDLKISSLEDYLVEYCNADCAYFVLERLSGKPGLYKSNKTYSHNQISDERK